MPALTDALSGRNFVRYHEPFLGGAALLLGLQQQTEMSASDANERLIETYRTVRSCPNDVAEALNRLPNEETSYYRIRAEQPIDAVEKAAQFIYLNHTSFNGVYRVNARGEYNVPFGRRRHLRIPDAKHLRSFATRMNQVDLQSGDFERAVGEVSGKDLVFLDPPYVTQRKTEEFARYNPKVFSFDDQRRLAASLKSAVDKGATFVMTNACDKSVVDLFRGIGFMAAVRRPSSVGGAKASTAGVHELLVSNIDYRAFERMTSSFSGRRVE